MGVVPPRPTSSPKDLSTLDRWSYKIAAFIFLVLRLFSRTQWSSKRHPTSILDIFAFVMEVGRACDLSLVPTRNRERTRSRSRYSVFRALFPVLKDLHHVCSNALEFVGFGEVARVSCTSGSGMTGNGNSQSVKDPSLRETETGPETMVVEKNAPGMAVNNSHEPPALQGPSSTTCGLREMRDTATDFEPAAQLDTIGNLMANLKGSDHSQRGDPTAFPPDEGSEEVDDAVLPVIRSLHKEDEEAETILSTTAVPDTGEATIQPLPKCYLGRGGRYRLDAPSQKKGAKAKKAVRHSIPAKLRRPKPHRRCCSWPMW